MSERKRDAADLCEALKAQGFDVVSCNTNGAVELADGATDAKKKEAEAFAKVFDFSLSKPAPILPLTDDEIRWVRDQMKAKVDAVR